LRTDGGAAWSSDVSCWKRLRFDTAVGAGVSFSIDSSPDRDIESGSLVPGVRPRSGTGDHPDVGEQRAGKREAFLSDHS
jgi:hypothetical protein